MAIPIQSPETSGEQKATASVNQTGLAQPLKQDNPFAKYGFAFTPDNRYIVGMKKPPLYSKTPVISIEEEDNVSLLTTNRDFLQQCFPGTERVYIQEDKQQILDVVSKIFTFITKQRLGDYANVIFMDQETWAKFQEKVDHSTNADEGKNYHGIHLSGLIVMNAEAASINVLFPLLFHELGHSLYPPSHESFIDEIRALFFGLICENVFEAQLNKLGFPYHYPEYDNLPSMDHKKAYSSAKNLYNYLQLNRSFQRHGLKQLTSIQDDSGYTMEQLLDIVKQTP